MKTQTIRCRVKNSNGEYDSDVSATGGTPQNRRHNAVRMLAADLRSFGQHGVVSSRGSRGRVSVKF